MLGFKCGAADHHVIVGYVRNCNAAEEMVRGWNQLNGMWLHDHHLWRAMRRLVEGVDGEADDVDA